MNRVDRAAKRAMRERERKERAAGPRPGDPALAERYDALFEQLTRCHCTAYARIDWNEVAGAGFVEPAVRRNEHEQKARRALANYQPGMIDSLLGLEKEKRRALAAKVLTAAKKDAEIYAKARQSAERHNLDIQLAAGVLALDLSSLESALKNHVPVDELRPSLEGFGVHMPSTGRLVVYVDAHELDAMPDETVAVGDNGRAVYTPILPGQRQEIHLANVCAVTLRIAAEVMRVAPVEVVDVVARCHLPDGRGGSEQHPVVHVRVPHSALGAMDLRRLEPVSTITALGGRIDWEIARGFAPIRIDDLNLASRKADGSAVAAA